MMKISMTSKEYRSLLDMLYIASCMMEVHELSKEPDHLSEYEILKKKILSYYKEMDADDIIGYSEDFEGHFEFHDYEHYLESEFVTPYNHKIFWQELIDRLAERDIVNELGIHAYELMSNIERIKRLDELRRYYAEEFKQYGLTNVYVSRKP